MAKTLIIIGLVCIVLGICWPLIQKLPFGQLPGDLTIKSENGKFYFPLTSCVIISIVLSLLFWIFRK